VNLFEFGSEIAKYKEGKYRSDKALRFKKRFRWIKGDCLVEQGIIRTFRKIALI
jgi:hypothetical protein